MEGGPEHDEPCDVVEAVLAGEGGGDEAAQAVADDEQRGVNGPLFEPEVRVVEEVLGVLAVQGDASHSFRAAVGSVDRRRRLGSLRL